MILTTILPGLAGQGKAPIRMEALSMTWGWRTVPANDGPGVRFLWVAGISPSRTCGAVQRTTAFVGWMETPQNTVGSDPEFWTCQPHERRSRAMAGQKRPFLTDAESRRSTRVRFARIPATAPPMHNTFLTSHAGVDAQHGIRITDDLPAQGPVRAVGYCPPYPHRCAPQNPIDRCLKLVLLYNRSAKGR